MRRMKEGWSRLHARHAEISECVEKEVFGDIYCSGSLVYITTGLDNIKGNFASVRK